MAIGEEMATSNLLNLILEPEMGYTNTMAGGGEGGKYRASTFINTVLYRVIFFKIMYGLSSDRFAK